MSWVQVGVTAIGAVGSVMASRQAGKAAGGAAEAQEEGLERAMEEIREDFGITEEQYAPFRQAAVGGRRGITGALGQQQAFLGLRGPEAQQQAYAGFLESPGQRFLRERGEQALLRQASAIGGFGGGNIRQALQEQGIGVAAQQQSELQDRLAGLTGLGFQATSGLGRERSRKAENIADLLGAQAQARASGILGQAESKSAGIMGATGGIGGIAGSLGKAFSDERLKCNIEELDLKLCYETVMSLPLKSWKYLEETELPGGVHFGPMAHESPDFIKGEKINGYETLNIHDELMLIAGALQYAKQNGLLLENKSCLL